MPAILKMAQDAFSILLEERPGTSQSYQSLLHHHLSRFFRRNPLFLGKLENPFQIVINAASHSLRALSAIPFELLIDVDQSPGVHDKIGSIKNSTLP